MAIALSSLTIVTLGFEYLITMNQVTGSKTVLYKNPYLILNNQGDKHPSLELDDNYHRLGRDPSQVDLIVPESWGVVGRYQAMLKKTGDDYTIYDGDGIHPSTNRLFYNHKLITPQEGYLLQDGMEIRVGQDPHTWVTITYYNPNHSLAVKSPLQKTVSLKNKSVSLGRDSSANLVLDSPMISRHHATIDQDSEGRYIVHDSSTNGIFINGQKVNKTGILSFNDLLRIGPYTLTLQTDQVTKEDELRIIDQGDYIRLDVEDLVKVVQDKQQKPLILLDHLTFPIEPSQLVGIVGESGTGKSTLLRTLLGIESLSEGKVYLNGENLHQKFNIYRNLMGYVPQSDIVHRELTVTEVLFYAAQLRLPPDSDFEDIIQKTLSQIDLIQRKNTLVKNLSGGQIKRVSIGVELLADPKLFLLDEPTSGLDPGLDKKMMELLANLADEGRTIILVTHATDNIKRCDRIIFLGKGGNLCYFGSPQEAVTFFQESSSQIQTFSDIYVHLSDPDTVQKEAQRFRNSDYYQDYIGSRLNYIANAAQFKAQQVKRSILQQFTVLTERYGKILLRDKLNLGLSLLTAPIGISLITLAIRGKEPLSLPIESDPSLAPLALRVLFVFTCAALWVGLASSLQEIVKESAIYLRERLVNLGLFAYLGSKISVLGALAVVQSLLISLVILIGFKSPKPDLMPWVLGLPITIFLTLMTSISLGLMVSSVVKNITQANSALPLLLLPQIIFSGVLFEMEGLAKYFSWLMLSHWSISALGALVNVNKMVSDPIILFDGTKITQPFEGSPVYEATSANLGKSWLMLILYAFVYLGIAYALQKRKDIR